MLSCKVTGIAVPTSVATLATAMGWVPASRMAFSDSEPLRLESVEPSEAISKLWCPHSGALAPSASKISICVPVFDTWSSPRITWVMPKSMSSMMEGSV